MPSISGIVKDVSGNPCSALVMALRRSDMSIAGMVFSNATTGAYSITTADTAPHVVKRYFGTPGDINAGYRRLGIHFSGANNSTSITDVYGHTITVNGDAKIDAVTTDPYGGTSGVLTCDGTGDYLSVADTADLELGNSDLTLRFKMKSSSSVSYCCPIGRDNGGFPAGAWAVMFNPGAANGRVQFWNSSYSNGSPLLAASSGDARDGSWHDIEIDRFGSDWYLFFDGNSVATASWSGVIADASLGINIGRDPGYSRDFSGQIKDVELFIGKALHTANFTPPSSTFIDYLIGSPTENAQIFDYVTPV